MIRWKTLLAPVGGPTIMAACLVAARSSDGIDFPGFLLLGASGATVSIVLTRRWRDGSNTALHAWLFVVILVAFFLGLFGLALLFVTSARSGPPATSNPQAAQDAARTFAMMATLMWGGIVIGTQAKHVGYRDRDVLFLLVPIYGMFFFAPKLLWRIAGLPRRSWDLSYQQPAAAGLVSEAGSGGNDRLPSQPVPNASLGSFDRLPLPPADQGTRPVPLVEKPIAADSFAASAPPSKKRVRLIAAVASVSLLTIAVGWASFARGEASEAATSEAEPASVVAPSVPATTTVVSPTPDSSCEIARTQLLDERSAMSEALDGAGKAFKAAKSRDAKADVLAEASGNFYVIGVRIQAVDAPVQLQAGKLLLAAAAEQLQVAMEQYSASWASEQSSPTAESDYEQGAKALQASLQELGAELCD